MLLGVGSRTYDVRTRALVIGVVGPSDLASAQRLVAEGADALVVEGGPAPVEAVQALAAAVEVPVGVATASAEVAAAAFEAGAVLAEDRSGAASPDWLAAAAGAGATVVLAAPGRREAVAARAAGARAAGVDADRIAVTPRALVWAAGDLGCTLVLDVGSEPTVVAASVAVSLGYRMVRTTDVRSARRVADAVAAVLEAE